MNTFYVISEEGQQTNEFDIQYFGDVIGHNQAYKACGGSIGLKRVSKPATSAEYDMKFRALMYTIKPIYKIPLFLDYHLEKYTGNPNEFISQIKYVILPQVERGNRPSYAKIVQDWLDEKNPKYESKSFMISTGDINAPIQIQQNSDNSSQVQKITYSKNDINLRGANIENYSVLNLASPSSNTTTSNFISKSLLTYESEVLPNKVFKIKNTISQQFNGLDGTNSETTNTYDIYNSPTQSTTKIKEGTTIVKTTTGAVIYDNQPGGATYYIGRPTSKTQSVTSSGDTMTSEELYAYTNHLLTQVKKKGHNTDYITEDNVYDPFGNITKKTITATGLTPRITNYEYDPSGRFLTKSIDIEGLATTFVYNNNS